MAGVAGCQRGRVGAALRGLHMWRFFRVSITLLGMRLSQRFAGHIQARFLLLMLAILLVNAGMFFILSYLSKQRLEYALFQRDLILLEGKWRSVVQTTAMLPVSNYPPGTSYKNGMAQLTELQQQIEKMEQLADQAQWLDDGLRDDLLRLLQSLQGALHELDLPYEDLSDFVAYHRALNSGFLQRPMIELIRQSWLSKDDDDPYRLFYLVRMYNNIARYDVSFSATLEARTADIRHKLDAVVADKFRSYELAQFGLGLGLSLLVILLARRVIALYNESLASKEAMADLSMRDVLTELPNRRALISMCPVLIEQAQQDSSGLFLMLLDVDDFKGVNDSLGHAAGDVLLRTLAHRMKAMLRSPSVAARLGGDEFVLLLPETPNLGAAQAVAQRLLDHVSSPISFEGKLLSFTLSIGIAQYPQDGGNLDDLLQSADTALYQAKKRGKNTYASRSEVKE